MMDMNLSYRKLIPDKMRVISKRAAVPKNSILPYLHPCPVFPVRNEKFECKINFVPISIDFVVMIPQKRFFEHSQRFAFSLVLSAVCFARVDILYGDHNFFRLWLRYNRFFRRRKLKVFLKYKKCLTTVMSYNFYLNFHLTLKNFLFVA